MGLHHDRRWGIAAVLTLICWTTEGFYCSTRSVQRTGTSPIALHMLKGSVYCAATLDGYIATIDGDVSFLNDFNDAHDTASDDDDDAKTSSDPRKDPYSFESFLSGVDCIIMGRKTFEKVLSFGRDMWAYGSLKLVVWTRQKDYRIPDYLAETVSCSDLSPTALWDELQNEGYEHAYIDGGMTINAFASHNLVEYWIITRVPLILGDGIPLFAKSLQQQRLTHIHTQTFPAGLVTSHYRSRRDEVHKDDGEVERQPVDR